MASGSGDATIYISGDVSGLQRATRNATREMDKVAKAADQANTSAAKSGAKMVAQIARIVETGKISAKSLDKVGKSAGNVISSVTGLAGGIGVALGLGALPALSDAAAKGIDALKQQMKGLSQETREAAAAQREYTTAQLVASGSADAVTIAQINLREATDKLNATRKDGKATSDDITKAEVAQRDAYRDLATAQNTHADATVKASKATKDFQKQMGDVLEKSKVFKRSNTGATILDQAASAKKAAAAFRETADSAEGLTSDQRSLLRSTADYIEKQKKIPKDIKTKVTAPGMSQTAAGLLGLESTANRLDGRRITITTIQDTITETHRLNNARGAFFPGTPNTRDDIPVNVSRGEAILNPQQIDLVGRDRVMGALSATGGRSIYAGGSYKSGGIQGILDRSKDRFSGIMSLDDLHLARAEQTTTFADDAGVLRTESRHIKSRIAQIHRYRKRYGKRMSRQQRQDLNDEEASLVRQLGDIGSQLNAPPDTGSGGGDTGPDPFSLQRAQDAGYAKGLGRALKYVFGGSGDIGSGGASALGSSGGVASLHVANLTIANTPKNTGSLATAGNSGNALLNRGRTYTSRTGIAFAPSVI